MTEKQDYDELTQLVIDKFSLIHSWEDLEIPVTDLDFTGIVQDITIELIPIPKPQYSALVKNERIGGRVWFKDENDRTCFHYYFKRRSR